MSNEWKEQNGYHVVPNGNEHTQNGLQNGGAANNEHEADEEEEETTTKCLSRSKVNIKAFTASMSFILMIHVAHHVYASGMLTSIEKRFKFGGSQLGLILAFYDMGQIPAAAIIPHFARNRHRPRIIAVGAFVSAFAALLSAMPHFILGSGLESVSEINPLTNKTRLMRTKMQVCEANIYGSNQSLSLDTCSTSEAEHSQQSNVVAYVIFVIAFIIKGIGSVPNFTLGVPYIDDHVKGATLPIYYGILFCAIAVGLIVGYLISGSVNKLFIDLSNPGISPRDPQWISAWWLGFVIISVLLLIAASTMLLFPESRDIQRQKKDENNSKKEITSKEDVVEVEDPDKGANIKDYLKCIRRLMTNVCFVVLTISAIFEGYLRGGLFTFMAKYMEAEYHTSASVASYAKAFIGPAIILGILAGGFVTSRFARTTLRKAKLLIIIGFITTGTLTIMMFFGCGPTNIAGTETSKGFELKLPCNSNCSCEDSSFTPVCGADGVTYFSPCHAGCTQSSSLKRNYYNFTDCACSGSAVPGKCPRNCNLFIPYNVINFIGSFVAVIAGPGGAVILMRIVEKEDRSRAIGFKSAIMNLLGDFPRPPIIGAAIDSTCLVWQKKCGVRGHCWLYDIVKFRFTLHGIGIVARVIATGCIAVVWYRISRYGLANEDEEDRKYRLKKEGIVEVDTKSTEPTKEKLCSRESVV